MADITLDRVVKVFPDGTEAVRGLSLEVADGELMVFVGPSGCGKTTALRMIAGLEEVSDGEIRIGDRVVNHLPPRERDVAMVFQNYALYPHKTVYDNLAFPLKVRKTATELIDMRVRQIARMLDLDEHLQRKPRQLSGGQRQRVAMGRAIVREPQAFLMDEPLSNLDAKLRTQMRAEIDQLQKELGVTTVYVTHDQVEAMTLGDRVALMRKGELQQVGRPKEIYDNPVNLFVAGFIGSPGMNFFEAGLAKQNGVFSISFGDQRLDLDETEAARRPALDRYTGRTVVVGVRPERLADGSLAPEASDGRRLRAQARLREELGSEVMVHFDVQADPALTQDLGELVHDIDDAMVDELRRRRDSGKTPFVGRFEADSRIREDSQIEVAVARGALHFFDLDTGSTIET